MRRILLLLAGAAILGLPAAAAARAQSDHAAHRLVVRNASTDGDVVTGNPVATVVVNNGFVIGHVAQEGAVKLYHFASGTGTGSVAAQVTGVDLLRQGVTWHGQRGTKYTGNDFRFRAVGGVWRVVVYGAGVSLYAGGTYVKAHLHGSKFSPHTDGVYAFDGERFASLPPGVLTRILGKKK
jgi:hypothetical protein